MEKSFEHYMREGEYTHYKALLCMVRDGEFDHMGQEVMFAIMDVCGTLAQHKDGIVKKENALFIGAGLHWDMVKRLKKHGAVNTD